MKSIGYIKITNNRQEFAKTKDFFFDVTNNEVLDKDYKKVSFKKTSVEQAWKSI